MAILFIVGYAGIIFEESLAFNKSGVGLLMAVSLWVVRSFGVRSLLYWRFLGINVYNLSPYNCHGSYRSEVDYCCICLYLYPSQSGIFSRLSVPWLMGRMVISLHKFALRNTIIVLQIFATRLSTNDQLFLYLFWNSMNIGEWLKVIGSIQSQTLLEDVSARRSMDT